MDKLYGMDVQQQRLSRFCKNTFHSVGEGLLLPGANLEKFSHAKIFVRRWTLASTEKEYLNPLLKIRLFKD